MLTDEGNFSKKRRYDVGTAMVSGSTSYVAARKATKGLSSGTGFKKKKRTKQELAILKGVKAAVRKIVDNRLETKISVDETTSQTLVAFSSTGPTGTVNAMSFENIDNGTDWNDRIGWTINLKRATFNFILTAGANAVDVMVVALANRANPAAGVLNSVTDVKITTSGATTGIQTTSDTNSILPWNNNSYEVFFAEVYQMAATDIQEGSAATIRRSVDCTRMFPKRINMGSTSAASPAKRVSWFFIPLSAVVGYPTVSITKIMEYTDA